MKRFIVEIDEKLLEALNREHGYPDSAESIAWAVYERDLSIDLPSNLIKVVEAVALSKVFDECYALCESCRGRKDGHEPLVQNYLEAVRRESKG